MAISFNDNLLWGTYISAPDWHKEQPMPGSMPSTDNQIRRVANELFAQAFKQPIARSIQCIRDTARLVLKVPIRSIWTPIVLSKNWKQYERAKINTKLAGYSFIQLVSIPVKFLVALTALATSVISSKRAKWLLDKSAHCTAYLDGRASQLEALKEVGRKNAPDQKEYSEYKKWLYSIDPKLCCKEG